MIQRKLSLAFLKAGLVVGLVGGGALRAEVSLPAVFGDGMVLQKSACTPIWGKAEPGENVVVSVGNLVIETKADSQGNWRVNFDLVSLGEGPFEVQVKGSNLVKFQDVLVGQVWLCSGQSNMEFTLNKTLNGEKEIAASQNHRLRHFTVKRKAELEPSPGVSGEWKSASPSTSGNFSAVAYFFGKKLQSELNEPVGLIHASWGGTPVEAWTSLDALRTEARLKDAADKLISDSKSFPEKKQTYIESLRAWSTKYGREDRKTASVPEYAGEKVPEEGWQAVRLPGRFMAAGLPDAGAVWLRRKVELPASMANRDLPLAVDDIFQFETIYWNGRKIGGTNLDNYQGEGSGSTYGVPRFYRIPGSLVKDGENTVAIRLFSAVGNLRVGEGRFQLESTQRVRLGGEWMAKPEFAFSPLKEAAETEMPAPLASAPRKGHVPSTLFNGMINPLVPFGIKGVIWYQGESNVSRANEYGNAFSLLINDWRSRWGGGDFPFYHCQLANYHPKKAKPSESGWAGVREAQSMALALPNTGQAVLIDLGEAGDVHPRDKQTVGERLAAIALARNYEKPIPFSGPVFKDMVKVGSQIHISFDHVGGRHGELVAKPVPSEYLETSVPLKTEKLVRNSPESPLEGFAICGEDRQWVWADARIEGNGVIVESPLVKEPVAVRYGWADNPTCNLYNSAGFPASPFRTDNFPWKREP